jgi:N-methylhydantoinase A
VKGERPAWFAEWGELRPTPVLDRYALAPGDRFVGPLLVEEAESTCVVGVGDVLQVDAHGHLVVTVRGSVGESS